MSTEVTSPTSNDSVNPPAAPVGAVPTANTMSAVVTRPTVDNGPAAACLALPRRPRIMMVDDEKLNSYVVAEYLKSDGHCDLIHVDNPLQALELATHVALIQRGQLAFTGERGRPRRRLGAV